MKSNKASQNKISLQPYANNNAASLKSTTAVE